MPLPLQLPLAAPAAPAPGATVAQPVRARPEQGVPFGDVVARLATRGKIEPAHPGSTLDQPLLPETPLPDEEPDQLLDVPADETSQIGIAAFPPLAAATGLPSPAQAGPADAPANLTAAITPTPQPLVSAPVGVGDSDTLPPPGDEMPEPRVIAPPAVARVLAPPVAPVAAPGATLPDEPPAVPPAAPAPVLPAAVTGVAVAAPQQPGLAAALPPRGAVAWPDGAARLPEKARADERLPDGPPGLSRPKPQPPAVPGDARSAVAMIVAQHAALAQRERETVESTPADDLPALTAAADSPRHLSAPQPALSAPPHMLARGMAQQMAVALTQSGDGTTEIALSPRELGHVRLTLTSTDTTVSLTIVAERPETAELLRRNLDALGQEFRALGFGSVSFSFQDRRAPREGKPDADRADLRPVEPASRRVDMSAPATPAGPTRGLDIRI